MKQGMVLAIGVLAAAFLAAMTGASAEASTLHYDGFAVGGSGYSVGNLTSVGGGQSGGNIAGYDKGTVGSNTLDRWFITHETTLADRFRIESGSLGYSDGNGNSLVTSAGHLRIDHDGSNGLNGRIFRPYDVSASSPFEPLIAAPGAGGSIGKDGSTLYFSFTFDSNIFNDGSYWTLRLRRPGTGGLRDGTNNNTLGDHTKTFGIGNINGGASNGKLEIRYNLNTTGSSHTASSAYDVGTVNQGSSNLLIVRFDFNSGADAVKVWLNPTNLADELANTPNISHTVANVSIDGLSLDRFGSANGGYIVLDEIRFATTWAGAVPIPEPSGGLLALLGAAAVALRRRGR